MNKKRNIITIMMIVLLNLLLIVVGALADGIPERLLNATYKKGANTVEILEIKKKMQEQGYFKAGADLSGNYNDIMVERVKQFQRDHGLKQTGQIDKDFLEVLYGVSDFVPLVRKITAKKKNIVIRIGEEVDLASLYSIEPANARKTLNWSITENPWQKSHGLVSSASITTKGNKQILIGNYPNFHYDFEDDRITITGTTIDGTNKSISIDVYVIPQNGIALDLESGEKWKELPQDNLELRLGIRNFKYGKEVKEFEMTLVCKNYSGTENVYKVITNKKASPGEVVYSDPFTIKNRSRIKEIDWWISEVRYSDDEICKVTNDPESQRLLTSDSFPWHSENNYSSSTAENPYVSDSVRFNSKMMSSVSEQISAASDLTKTKDTRAVLAALLTLEYKYQDPSFEFDYSLPIYVCKAGNMASVAFAGKDRYVMVIYQTNPLSTYYAYLYGTNAAMVKASLELTSDNVWSVSINDYNEKLANLVDQLK